MTATEHSRIRDHVTHVCQVSAKTVWLFLEIRMDNGMTGTGELSHFGIESGVLQYLSGAMPSFVGLTLSEAVTHLAQRRKRMRDAMSSHVHSGMEQALVDARAKGLGLPATELLGGRQRDQVMMYANINRGTSDRTPKGWAARAKAAVAAQYAGIKIAPFDGVDAADPLSGSSRAKIDHGLACIAAVREAIGPNVYLNVDLHGRFNRWTAVDLIREMAAWDVHWIEAPIHERLGALDDCRAIRQAANAAGIRVAGAEDIPSLAHVAAFIRAGALDVFMPDLRSCGGVFEACDIANLVTQSDLEFSVHNPAGPVLDAISLSVAASATSTTMIERQFDESPAYGTALITPPETPTNGAVSIGAAAGWGIALNNGVLDPSGGVRFAGVDHFDLSGSGPFS
ncbi:D-galactonate dehydratase [Marinovum algicola]|uniref:Galactonate dehydratase n=1 Tax=Marinovum algicola TaxID=42444 RepID=A0A975WF70_9RHOB|nr:enolase C-terminal domain-like protein [Marinovum algicola]SEK10394.1 galactonate dehydratase [Marinovum algicola]SLN77144.1 D-galactonate dehydratase [Marinovum algicola]